jgi:hypothetical protein
MFELKRLVPVKKAQNCQNVLCTRGGVFDEAETGVDTTEGVMHMRCAVERYVDRPPLDRPPPGEVIEWSEPLPQNDALVLCKYDHGRVMRHVGETRGQSWQVAKL